MQLEEIKKKVGEAAAEFVEAGMLVGLGTGSTTYYFIQKLIERCKMGLKIHAVASSEQSLKLAKQGGIPLLDLSDTASLDLTVDGADEIDSKKRMIKGGGGALVREKIVASMSREMVVIIDSSKLSPKLGKSKLPVEIIPFAPKAAERQIEKLGFNGSWRIEKNHKPYLTDNGNLIFDIHFPSPLDHPEAIHEALIHVPGVVDTGFFFHLAGRVVIGYADGQIIIEE